MDWLLRHRINEARLITILIAVNIAALIFFIFMWGAEGFLAFIVGYIILCMMSLIGFLLDPIYRWIKDEWSTDLEVQDDLEDN